MKKELCTKGPYLIDSLDSNPDVKCFNTLDDRRIAEVLPYDLKNGEAEANADLIAEAFNVLHETGMTPRELAEQVKDMREALQALVDDDEADDHDGDRKRRYFENASEVLSKYRPVTRA